MAGNTGIYELETSIKASFDESLIHGIVVSNLAYFVAKELGLTEEDCIKMANAGILHDIGKLRLRNYVYKEKSATMAIDELRYIRLHPSLGYAILKEQGYDADILEAVLYHHENIDGSGYPNNLSGEEIPLGGRILRVCDAFGALLSNRACRGAFDIETATAIMIDDVKHYDMQVFLAFMKVVKSDAMKEILRNFGID